MQPDPSPISAIWMLFFLGFLGVMSVIAIYGGNRAKHRRAERARTGRVDLRDRVPRRRTRTVHVVVSADTRQFREAMDALGRSATKAQGEIARKVKP